MPLAETWRAPPPCPHGFPEAGGSQGPHKLLLISRGCHQMPLDQTQDKAHHSLVSWTQTRKHVPCCRQSKAHSPPLGNQPILGSTPCQGPHGYHLAPLPAAQPGDAGAESALGKARGSAFVPASKGTGRNRAEGEGKVRRGHLSSFSVSREREIFTAGYHNLV